jgi:hypothetical protein
MYRDILATTVPVTVWNRRECSTSFLREAVLALHRATGVLALIESGALRLGMSLADEAPAVRKLFDRYHNVPASRWRTSVWFEWLRFTISA